MGRHATAKTKDSEEWPLTFLSEEEGMLLTLVEVKAMPHHLAKVEECIEGQQHGNQLLATLAIDSDA
eukprot:6181433-Pleurochrysis_carterae.AAC.1